MKYKVITVSDSDLVKELEMWARSGFEVVKFIEEIKPNSSSDFAGWRILLIKRK